MVLLHLGEEDSIVTVCHISTTNNGVKSSKRGHKQHSNRGHGHSNLQPTATSWHKHGGLR